MRFTRPQPKNYLSCVRNALANKLQESFFWTFW
jgi:hypothetical protein